MWTSYPNVHEGKENHKYLSGQQLCAGCWFWDAMRRLHTQTPCGFRGSCACFVLSCTAAPSSLSPSSPPLCSHFSPHCSGRGSDGCVTH